MNILVYPRFFIIFLCLLSSSVTKESPPIVQVYSRTPGYLGKPNVLICHMSNFYPPLIKVDLLNDGKVSTEATETELSFEENWEYYMTKYIPFTPQKGEEYTCRVTHMGVSRLFVWEPDT
uniref:beta-2-microglobulin-like n=1 Tax=Doryrhamphus excisus TaxID=161450 RepID=UPI0025AE11FE|nr:beta-2-microglobulin-like [Doryrhamphus excisus]XP_057922586.1 beta-2-microglobulin-like [Doryrhamphus excisus]